MNVSQVAKRISEIANCAGDPEAAHAMEDDLRADILSAIARGQCESPAECAAMAITTDGIDFPRWCA